MKLQLKRMYAGEYEATLANTFIEVYKSETGYWSSTVTTGKYGDSGWKEEIHQGYTKSEVVKSIKVQLRKEKLID